MRTTALLPLLALAACTPPGALEDPCSWTQVGRNSWHHGFGCTAAQLPERMLGDVHTDPFVDQELGPDNALRIHYQAPLVAGDDVYVELKSGDYTPCVDTGGNPVPCGPDAYASQHWGEEHLRWLNGQLHQSWSFDTDWKPVPFMGTEQGFHAALYGNTLYLPGAGGRMIEVDRHSGLKTGEINPFGNGGSGIDNRAYVAGPPSISADGTVYYTVIYYPPVGSDLETIDFGAEGVGYIVRAGLFGVSKKSFPELIPEAPRADSLCYLTFPPGTPGPLPPADNADGSPALPPQATCGSQRPQLDAAPAIGVDGTVYLITRAHHSGAYGYLLALDGGLGRKWATSFRDHLSDGCGIRATCRDGAAAGVDPSTNLPPAGRVEDSSTSSPVVVGDGVLVGTWSGYNGFRGHLLKFTREGSFVTSYDFGWDHTPAVWVHDGTYSVIVKDNVYFQDRYFITQLNAELRPEWSLEATNHQSCERGGDGTVACEDTPFENYEWCINAPAVDRDGTVHVLSEDGNLYAIQQGGTVKARAFTHKALPSGYTPVVLDDEGRIYTMNDGYVSVFGK